LGGAESKRSAMVFKFWTMAARWNSSRAPAHAGQPTQPKPLEGVMGLEVSKAHLDPRSLVA